MKKIINQYFYLFLSKVARIFINKYNYRNHKKKVCSAEFKENFFKLSRSKLELFIECPRCFYLKCRMKIERPGNRRFSLNDAVDALLKKEFDLYRNDQKPHPLCIENGINAVPFNHANMQNWRRSLGLEYKVPNTNIIVHGRVDDIWMNQDTQELMVVDYKATSKSSKLTLDYDSYKRQIEVYQWLLRKNGFNVSNIAYFVYCNGKKESALFDKNLNFDIYLLEYIGDDSWVEKAILSSKLCLQSNTVPAPSSNCEYCRYLQATLNILPSS